LLAVIGANIATGKSLKIHYLSHGKSWNLVFFQVLEKVLRFYKNSAIAVLVATSTAIARLACGELFWRKILSRNAAVFD